MRLRAIALLVLLPLAALAADAPEEVFKKFHGAAMAGNLEEMLKYGPAQRRAEVQGMPAASKEAALKTVQFLMPRGFQVHRMTVHDDGRGILHVSGPLISEGKAPMTMYGTVRMLQENGEWKVDEATWSTQKPAALSPPRPAPAPAAAPVAAGSPAPKAVAAPKPPAPGTIYREPPIRKLGEAKVECVYKPVMTAKDIENCK